MSSKKIPPSVILIVTRAIVELNALSFFTTGYFVAPSRHINNERGLYSLFTVKKGERVGVFKGDYVTSKEELSLNSKNSKNLNNYTLQWKGMVDTTGYHHTEKAANNTHSLYIDPTYGKGKINLEQCIRMSNYVPFINQPHKGGRANCYFESILYKDESNIRRRSQVYVYTSCDVNFGKEFYVLYNNECNYDIGS